MSHHMFRSQSNRKRPTSSLLSYNFVQATVHMKPDIMFVCIERKTNKQTALSLPSAFTPFLSSNAQAISSRPGYNPVNMSFPVGTVSCPEIFSGLHRRYGTKSLIKPFPPSTIFLHSLISSLLISEKDSSAAHSRNVLLNMPSR